MSNRTMMIVGGVVVGVFALAVVYWLVRRSAQRVVAEVVSDVVDSAADAVSDVVTEDDDDARGDVVETIDIPETEPVGLVGLMPVIP